MRKIILSQEEEIKIVRLYTEGHSMNRVCKILNHSIHVVTTVLIKNNIPRRKDSTRKYTFNESYFENINTPNKAYWLGWIVSDGSVNDVCFRIRIQEKDIAILHKFKQDIQFTGPIKVNPNYNLNHQLLCGITLHSKKLLTDLKQWGVVPRKARKTFFPNIPKILWSHFIRGVFDGDGTVNVHNKGFLQFSISGSNTLINEINDIISICSGIKKTKVYFNELSNVSSLRYTGNNVVVKIRNWLYKDCEDLYLKRKHEKFFNSHHLLTKPAKFENHGASKLSNLQVIDIYKSNKTRDELANIYNVKVRTIQAIQLQQNWKKLTDTLSTGLTTELK